MKLPYFKFFPGDWQKDPDLKRCSHVAKGVLMDILCMAFESRERGVCVSGGNPWSEKELAEAVGGNIDVVVRAIIELIQKGVLKKREDGAIYSARMVKDEAIRQKRANGGHLGGNPQLKVNLKENLLPTLLLELESESSVFRLEGGREEGKPQPLVFPDSLRTARFQKAWNDWVPHRMSVGKSVNYPVMFQKQLVWLSEFPHDLACKMVDQAVRFGWQSIHEINSHYQNGHANGHTPRALSVNELRAIMQAKENKAIELKRKHCSEVAMGETWSDMGKRHEYFEIKNQIKKINNQISAFA